MTKIQVLDHGYIEFIEAWGCGKAGRKHGFDRPIKVAEMEPFMREDDFEVAIIEAARQSTQGSFRDWESTPCSCDSTPHEKSCTYQPGDMKLLRYLYSHSHLTPFEFAGMTLEVQAPIFVFREWHRHRTQSYNEMSARYEPLPELYYVPTVENIKERVTQANNSNTKQSKATTIASNIDGSTIEFWDGLVEWYNIAEKLYQRNLEIGVPKELARCVMPVGHYSRMHVSANLRNWLQFLTLRCDPQAQWEIRQFANAVLDVVKEKFPRTCELFLTQGEEK